MSQTVNIPGLGVVSFPDEMSQDQIANAIKTELLPSLQTESIDEPKIPVEEEVPIEEEFSISNRPLEWHRSLISGFAGTGLSGVSGLATLANAVTDMAGYEDAVYGDDRNQLIRLADAGKEWIEENYGVSEAYKDDFDVKLAGALGSLASFFIPGTAVVKGAQLLGWGARAAAVAGASTTAIQGVMLGADEGKQRLDARRQNGDIIDEPTANRAILIHGAVGASEALPFMRLFQRISKVLPPGFKQKVFRKFRSKALNVFSSAAAQGFAEGSQELAAGLAQDAVELGLYNENALMGETMWDDFTLGASAGAIMDAITTGVMGRRSRLTKRIERIREAGLREKESDSRERYFDIAEAAKAQIEAERVALIRQEALAAEGETTRERLAKEYQAQQASAQVEPITIPYESVSGQQLEAAVKKGTIKLKDAMRLYAARIARDVMQSGIDAFPASGTFEISESMSSAWNDKGYDEPVYAVRHSDTGKQYGRSFPEREHAIHLMLNLNNQIRIKNVDRSLLDAIHLSPETYNDTQSQTLFSIGQRVVDPKHNTITSVALNEAAGTVDSPTNPYDEGATLDNLQIQQFGVPAVRQGKRKYYQPLINLTAAQQVNFDRSKKGLPEVRTFSLAEARNVLGEQFPKLFDVLVKSRAENPEGLIPRNEFIFDKDVKDRIRKALDTKNISSNINSPEIKYLAEAFTGDRNIKDMSAAQRRHFYYSILSLPQLDSSTRLPDFKPRLYSREQFADATRVVQETGDGTIGNIIDKIGVVGTERQAELIAREIHNDLKAQGVIDANDRVSSFEILTAPAAKPELEIPDVVSEQVSDELIILTRNLRKVLDGFGLNEVGLNINEVLKIGMVTREGEIIPYSDPEKQAQAESITRKAGAYYLPFANRIFLALDGIDPKGTLTTLETRQAALTDILTHEIIHPLRMMDLWTNNEWKLLENLAKKKMRKGNITYYHDAWENYRDLPNYTPVRVMEEAVANLIKDARTNPRLTTGKPRGLINRIYEFFERLRNALRGTGFKSFNDVVTSLEAGVVGARERGKIRTMRATELAEQAVPERGIGMPADVIDIPVTEVPAGEPSLTFEEGPPVDEITKAIDKLEVELMPLTSTLRQDTGIGAATREHLQKQIESKRAEISRLKELLYPPALSIREEMPEPEVEVETPESIIQAQRKIDELVDRSPEDSSKRMYDETVIQPILEETAEEGDVIPTTFQTKSYRLWDKIIYNVQDKFIGLKDYERGLNEWLASKGRPTITSLESAYEGEERLAGKIGDEIREFTFNRKVPISEKIAKARKAMGIDVAEVDEYLTLRHAIERNKRIAAKDESRNPETNPGSGALPESLGGDRLSDSFVKRRMENRYGMTWDDVAGTWSGGNRRGEMLQDIAKDVDAIVRETTDRIVKGGLVSREDADIIEGIFKYYAPLRGKDMEDEIASITVGAGLSIRGQEYQRAKGRESAAESPLGHIMISAERAMVRANKNTEFGQTLVNLIRKYPNPEFWRVIDPSNFDEARITQEFDRKYTYVGNDPELLKLGPQNDISAYDNKKDWVKQLSLKRNTGIAADRDLLAVKMDGKQVYVDILDPRLRRAMVSIDSSKFSDVIGKFGMVNRWLSMVNTSLNPEFVLGNFERDIQAAVWNLLAEQEMAGGKAAGEKIVRQVVLNTPHSMGVFYRGLRRWNVKDGTFKNTAGLSEKDAADFREFMSAGAKADWFHSRPAQDQIKDIQSMVEMASGTFRGNFRRRFNATKNFIEDINSSVENAVRLSSFTALRDRLLDNGINRPEAVAKAATLAKNLTINFNRKGMQGDLLNSTYLFFNASVQGIANFARGLNIFDPKSSRMKQGAAGGIIMLGALMSMRAEEESEENPKTGRSYYSEIDNWIKQRNMIIMKEDGINYYTIPLPYGYNLFYAIGSNVYEYKAGLESGEQVSWDLIETFLGSFSPVGVSVGAESWLGKISKTVTPTVFTPVVELLTNENHWGSPIVRENIPFGTQFPKSQLPMQSTAPAFKNTAKFINALTGGTEYEPGWGDFSPDSMEHFAEYIFGGAGTFTLRTEKALRSWAKGEDVPYSQTPFIRRMMREPNDREAQSEYYSRIIRLRQKQTAKEEMRGAERNAHVKKNKDYFNLVPWMNNAERKIRNVREQINDARARAARSPEDAKEAAIKEEELYDELSAIYGEFNKRWDKKIGRLK